MVCDGCSTRLQGRNFCAGCLEARADEDDEDAVLESGAVVRVGLGLMTVVSTGLLALTAFAFGFFLYMVG